jgi:2-C-methyl-D-erythritol 2,4-cyclodiphosphate synthase
MSRFGRPLPKRSNAPAGRRCQMRRSLVTIHAMTTIRVGIGHDTHRLAEGRPLLLGGVRIAHPRGLIGHSDADVVLHALTDALLGAAGLGDIGDAYPDTEPAWKDADSRVFLRETLARLNRDGWRIVNVDIILFAQEPKLGPIKADIRKNLAQLLGLDAGCVNIKAKTGEHVGHIGRAEALACQAAVLIEQKTCI